ncbi:MAG: cation diffusion facilitator family transporter [Candidatus Sericytochromatia bacterium]
MNHHDHEHSHNHSHEHKKHNHHEHNHNHSHSHEVDSSNIKILSFSLVITFSFMFSELIGGVISKSLSLISDAGHMFSDSFALLIAIIAVNLGSKKANTSKSFGYKRAETIAAFVNGILLLISAILIIKESIYRLFSPEKINSEIMLLIAILGLIANIVVAGILFKSSKENLNIKSAFLHVIGDLLGSIGVIVSSIIIKMTGNTLSDPIVSILIAILITHSSINIIKQTFHILMEGTPININISNILEKIKKLHGVSDIHDLHIWSLDNKKNILTAHIVLTEGYAIEEVKKSIKDTLAHEFEINHSTLEFENIKCNTSCD